MPWPRELHIYFAKVMKQRFRIGQLGSKRIHVLVFVLTTTTISYQIEDATTHGILEHLEIL
jgi:hypothetical protein